MPKNDADIVRTSELIARAHEVASKLKDRARAIDQAREIPIESVNDLHESGLLAMSIPRASGGTEADLVTVVSVYEILAKACASTTWCLVNHVAACDILQRSLGGASGPYLRAVVEDGAALGFGALPSEAETKESDGGYMTTGRWPFISFSYRCRWVLLITRIQGSPAGQSPTGPDGRCLIVPLAKDGVRIEDTWKAMSLRGTMSNDVVLDHVFFPEEQAPVFTRPSPGETSIESAPAALRAAGLASGRLVTGPIMLGVAQAALDSTIEFAVDRDMTLGGSPRTKMPGNQFAVADAAMYIESARALLYQEARSVTAKAESGIPFTPDDSIRFSMAGLVATQNAQSAVDRLFAIRGAHGLYEEDEFERYYRDVRMGTLVANQTPDLVREWLGKHLFGIPADVQPRWG